MRPPRNRLRGLIPSEAVSWLGGVAMGSLTASLAQTTIGPDSVVNLGTVVGICGGIVWLNVTLNRIQNRLKNIESMRPETWTYNMQRAWTLDLQNRNRDMAVPVPPERGPGT